MFCFVLFCFVLFFCLIVFLVLVFYYVPLFIKCILLYRWCNLIQAICLCCISPIFRFVLYICFLLFFMMEINLNLNLKYFYHTFFFFFVFFSTSPALLHAKQLAKMSSTFIGLLQKRFTQNHSRSKKL